MKNKGRKGKKNYEGCMLAGGGGDIKLDDLQINRVKFPTSRAKHNHQ